MKGQILQCDRDNWPNVSNCWPKNLPNEHILLHCPSGLYAAGEYTSTVWQQDWTNPTLWRGPYNKHVITHVTVPTP